MDTPDRAAGLAEPGLADAINREWLLVSASSQVSAGDWRDLRSRSRVGKWLTSSYSVNDNVRHNKAELHNTTPGVESRLLGSQRYGSARRRTIGPTQTLLYDNISFADSSPLIRSLTSRKISLQVNNYGAFRGEQGEASTKPPAGKFRLVLACYLLLGITLAIYSRNALSLAAIEMVASNKINKEVMASPVLVNVTSKIAEADNSCPILDDKPDDLVPRPTVNERSNLSKELFLNTIKQRIATGELVDWTPGEQGLIFAAGSVGNLLIAIPLTRMGEIYGSKWIIFLALCGATLQAALMPIVAGAHVALVILFQVVFNGLTFGADCVAYTLFAHWLTPTEMAFFVACLLVCYQLGAIISSAITAKILVAGIGWSWCFYMPAILCAAWTLIWAFVGASEPLKSWIISDDELEFLLESSKISQMMTLQQEETQQPANRPRQASTNSSHAISWLKLAKDPNIWAIVAVKFTLRWYFSVSVSLLPTYLSSVAHMSISTIGKVNVFQSCVGLLSGLLMSYLTRSVVSKRPYSLSLATVRKIFQSIVNFGLGLSLLAFIAFDCNQWITIISLTLCGICVNFYVAAGLQLPLDLSPEHCGLITSISNTLALGQALGAPISGLILNHGPRSRSMWRIVWGLAILLNTLSGFLFILLVDSKTRDYNRHEHDEQEGNLATAEQKPKMSADDRRTRRSSSRAISSITPEKDPPLKVID